MGDPTLHDHLHVSRLDGAFAGDSMEHVRWDVARLKREFSREDLLTWARQRRGESRKHHPDAIAGTILWGLKSWTWEIETAELEMRHAQWAVETLAWIVEDLDINDMDWFSLIFIQLSRWCLFYCFAWLVRRNTSPRNWTSILTMIFNSAEPLEVLGEMAKLALDHGAELAPIKTYPEHPEHRCRYGLMEALYRSRLATKAACFRILECGKRSPVVSRDVARVIAQEMWKSRWEWPLAESKTKK